MQTFVPTDYYAWFYEGSQWTTYLGGVAMVAIMLAGVMFPLWPPIMRLGVWYLSIGVLGLLGLFFGLAIVRLIFYIVTVIVASPGIWIFPKLFADVGFVSTRIHTPRTRVADVVCATGGIIHPAMGVGPAQEEEQEEAVGEGQGDERECLARPLRADRGGAGFGQFAASESHSSTRRGGAGRGLMGGYVSVRVVRAVLRCIYVPGPATLLLGYNSRYVGRSRVYDHLMLEYTTEPCDICAKSCASRRRRSASRQRK